MARRDFSARPSYVPRMRFETSRDGATAPKFDEKKSRTQFITMLTRATGMNFRMKNFFTTLGDASSTKRRRHG